MPLKLRQATLSELPAIVHLINIAYRGQGAQAGWATETAYITGDRTTEPRLRAELATKPRAVLLLTDSNGPPGPTACVWLEPLTEDTWYLGSLTINPQLQNAGLGRELLASAEAWAQAQGAQTIQMTVVNVRTQLIAWYQRRGYHLTGITEPFPYGDTRFGTPLREDLAFVVLEKRWPAGQRLVTDAPTMI